MLLGLTINGRRSVRFLIALRYNCPTLWGTFFLPVILSEAKNLFFVGQILRLRLRMTRKCQFCSFYH
jgi:hypothetical protein